MSGAAPLRFLGLVLGGWVAARAIMLVPGWWPETAETTAFAETAPPEMPLPIASAALPFQLPVAIPTAADVSVATAAASTRMVRQRAPSTFSALAVAPEPAWPSQPSAPLQSASRPPFQRSSSLPVALSRWSVSAWALVRRGGEGNALVPGGLLGGSQAGLRVIYALRPSLRISGRLSSPLSATDGSEAALGLEWQPLAHLPLRILAERRQEIGHEGRSAFAFLAHGGVSDQRLIGPVRMDAYGQAGIVGTRSRDAFVDGAVRLGMPVGDGVDIGAGLWGAAQPGVARLDVGPSASYRLPGLGQTMRISADWRVRVAGDARPGSGPALTLSTDF